MIELRKSSHTTRSRVSSSAQTDEAHRLLAHELWTATRETEAREAMHSARIAFRAQLDAGIHPFAGADVPP